MCMSDLRVTKCSATVIVTPASITQAVVWGCAVAILALRVAEHLGAVVEPVAILGGVLLQFALTSVLVHTCPMLVVEHTVIREKSASAALGTRVRGRYDVG